MTSELIRTIAAAGLGLSLFAAPALAQDAGDSGGVARDDAAAVSSASEETGATDALQWDTDRDTRINRAEWDQGFGAEGVFDRYDRNRDGGMDADEFGAFSRQGVVSQGENAPASTRPTFADRFGEGAFETWDRDRDSRLSRSEFDEGVFSGYDRDRSGDVDRSEYRDARDDLRPGSFWGG